MNDQGSVLVMCQDEQSSVYLNGLNGHFMNNAYDCVSLACLFSLAPEKKRKLHSVWL